MYILAKDVSLGEHVVIESKSLPDPYNRVDGTFLGKVVPLDDISTLGGSEENLQQALEEGYVFLNIPIRDDTEEGSISIAMAPDTPVVLAAVDDDEYWVERTQAVASITVTDLTDVDPSSLTTFSIATRQAAMAALADDGTWDYVVIKKESSALGGSRPVVKFRGNSEGGVGFSWPIDLAMKPEQKLILVQVAAELESMRRG